MKGLAKMNVQFRKEWSAAEVHKHFQDSFPHYFKYEDEKGPRKDGRTEPWVLAFKEGRRMVLSEVPEPGGEVLYGLKGRSGRGKIDSLLFIGESTI
jgi:hypothetical protein